MSSRLSGIVSIVSLSLTTLLIFFILLRPAPKIAYVDSAKLINGYQGMIDARKVYQKKVASWQANIDTLANEVRQRVMNYDKESSKMSAKEKELTKEVIRTKEQQLRDYGQAMNSQAKQEDDKMTADVVSQMNAYIKKFGKQSNYTIVLAATNGSILYAEDALDITDSVLEGLNHDYKGQ